MSLDNGSKDSSLLHEDVRLIYGMTLAVARAPPTRSTSISPACRLASALVKCDSCLIYMLEGDELVLRHRKLRTRKS